jgi:uroporphyrinogen decarboxylase
MGAVSKPLLRVLGGEAVWPPPVWLMRQAGRYLPEYRTLRAKVPSFIALATTPELAAEVTLQPIRRYRMDGAILFSDILMLPWALGHGLDFREGEGPVMPALRDEAGVRALQPGHVARAVEPIMQTVRRVCTGLAAEGYFDTALIGFAGGPFTVACYMVEGGGSRDFPAVREMAHRDPDLLAWLLGVLTEATIDYLSAQVSAGAETVMLFDSWAGILSPVRFRACVIDPTRRIVSALQERHPGIPVIGFPRLAGTMLGEYAATGVKAVGVDTATNLEIATRLLPGHVAVQGNLDPLTVLTGGCDLRSEVHGILGLMRNRPFVFNLGHGIVPQTPPENVAELVGLVRAG